MSTLMGQVIKLVDFRGRLPARSLYIYLPPGYNTNVDEYYPVLFMHDGQNCFETHVTDSFAGSWKADVIADRMILRGEMSPCIIVGVSNGGEQRLVEYLPPYAAYPPHNSGRVSDPSDQNHSDLTLTQKVASFGQADRTVAYYQEDVMTYITQNFRVREGRDHTATCGSSMGGLFSAYMAWEHPEFARHHAVMSPSFWITKSGTPPRTIYEIIDRFLTNPPRDLRLWLDSGTRTGGGSTGDDGMKLTQLARDALLANGFRNGPDFQYFLAQGASHNEAAWSKRLNKVLRFLFPPHSSA